MVNGAVGGLHVPAKLGPIESVPNPFPELRPGGSFMNLLLAADWVASQLELDCWSHEERLELVEAHVSLVTQMRHTVRGLSKVKLDITKSWVDRVRAMSSQIGRRDCE